mgnify:CR=1 FL=1
MTNGNDSIHNSEQGPQDGLTKREYFAVMAMQGMMANPELLVNGSTNMTTANQVLNSYAEDAVKSADALIEQLNKTNL